MAGCPTTLRVSRMLWARSSTVRSSGNPDNAPSCRSLTPRRTNWFRLGIPARLPSPTIIPSDSAFSTECAFKLRLHRSGSSGKCPSTLHGSSPAWKDISMRERFPMPANIPGGGGPAMYSFRPSRLYRPVNIPGGGGPAMDRLRPSRLYRPVQVPCPQFPAAADLERRDSQDLPLVDYLARGQLQLFDESILNGWAPFADVPGYRGLTVPPPLGGAASRPCPGLKPLLPAPPGAQAGRPCPGLKSLLPAPPGCVPAPPASRESHPGCVPIPVPPAWFAPGVSASH